MTCDEMNKVVESMGTFMNRTTCPASIDPSLVMRKRDNEMNLVMNALLSYAPRVVDLKARYDGLQGLPPQK